MTEFRWSHYIEKHSVFHSAPIGNSILTIDGTIVHTFTHPTSHQGRTDIPDDGKMHVAKFETILSGKVGDHYEQKLEVWNSVDQVIVGRYFHGIAPFTSILNLTWLARGLPQAPPTYLEELAKLDQYSKAQYIPQYRQHNGFNN